MVSVGAAEETRPPASTTEESGAHDAHRFGFSIRDEDDAFPQPAGVPATRRPLSRASIRHWTAGSLIGSLLLAAVVAVAVSRSPSVDATGERARADAVAAQAPEPLRQPPAVVPSAAAPAPADAFPRPHAAARRPAAHKAASRAPASLTTKPAASVSKSAGTAPPPGALPAHRATAPVATGTRAHQ